MATDQPAAATGTMLGAETWKKLSSAQGWSRFVSLIGFAGALFSLVGVASMMALPQNGALPLPNKVTLAISTFIGFGSMLVFSVVLWRFASDAADARRGRASGVVGVFRNLRYFWIAVVIVQVLYIAIGIVSAVTGTDGLPRPITPSTPSGATPLVP